MQAPPQHRAFAIVASVLMSFLAACAGSGTNALPTPVASVSVTLDSTTLFIGQTTQGSALVKDANGSVLTGRAVTWSSSDTAVATVDASTGLVTSVGVGAASIAATSEGKSGSASLAVSLVPVSSVTVTLGSSSVHIGQTTLASAVVKDASGNVLTGRTITWSSSNPAVATVNGSSGLVTAVMVGMASITAASEGKTGFATVTAANTSADVVVSVRTPSPGQPVSETVHVVVTVTSTYQIASVTASAGGNTVLLSYGSYRCGNIGTCVGWVGTLSLAGQPRGPVVLIVTATDAAAHSTDVVVNVVLDSPPVVSVTAPLQGTVARPRTDLVATCADDSSTGCGSLTATIGSTVVASGRDSISQSLDLSAFEGQSVSLVITGVDAIGQRTTITRALFVESSSRLSTRAEVNGTVWDASGTRVLFLDVSGPTPALKVQDTTAGTTQTLETGTALGVDWGDNYGFLTPAGAIYVHRSVPDVYPYFQLYEWRAGVTSSLGGINSSTSLRVAGNWAIYNGDGGSINQGDNLWRRDLVAGVSTVVSTDASNIDNDVAANGDVVYWDRGYNIYRWRGGSTEALTTDSSTIWNIYPVTDGVNVVYRKRQSSGQALGLALHDGTRETILATGDVGDYAVAGGYVTYGVADLTRALQVWRRGPGGAEQLSIFSTSSAIDAIGFDGTVLLTHSGRRYRASPGIALQEIGSSLGRVIVRDGVFLVLLGGTVLEVGP